MSIINSTPVRVIAIVGCDGSGKSTLTASLVNELAARMPAEHILGNGPGELANGFHSSPVIGAPFGRYLRSKAAHVHEKPYNTAWQYYCSGYLSAFLLAGVQVSQNVV